MSNLHILDGKGNIPITVYRITEAYHFNFPCDNISKRQIARARSKALKMVKDGEAEDIKQKPDADYMVVSYDGK